MSQIITNTIQENKDFIHMIKTVWKHLDKKSRQTSVISIMAASTVYFAGTAMMTVIYTLMI